MASEKLWCSDCRVHATVEQETGDCWKCGRSMWSSRTIADGYAAAETLKPILVSADDDERLDILHCLGVCFYCFKMRQADWSKPACCEQAEAGRKSLRKFDAAMAAAMDKFFASGDPFTLERK